MTRVGRLAIGLALAALLGCSETETKPAPPPTPAPAAPAAGANVPTPPPAADPAPIPSPEAPQQLDEKEAEQARRSIEASLEDVRRQLQDKAAELGPQQPPPAQP